MNAPQNHRGAWPGKMQGAGPTPGLPAAAGLDWGQESVFQTTSHLMLMLLVQEPRLRASDSDGAAPRHQSVKQAVIQINYAIHLPSDFPAFKSGVGAEK